MGAHLPDVLIQTADVTGIIAIVMVFTTLQLAIKKRYELKRDKQKQLPREARSTKELEPLRQENRLLRERVEHLETIVCSVDYELNQQIKQLVDAERSVALSDTDRQPMQLAAGGGGSVARARTDIAPKESHGSGEFERGEVVEGRYEVHKLLGRGGMGAVYLCEDNVLSEQVALKIVAPSFAMDATEMAERFRREASAARKVTVPQVIRIYDVGETAQGLLYMSMEYFPGRTLGQMLETRTLPALSQRIDILDQICLGLAAAHHAGVIHRDLKPQNVLCGERNAVKVIDFGLAKTSLQKGMTATGLIMGTPEYMSPEQVKGGEIDTRSDIYSLGALAYHLVTGQPPFSDGSPIAIGFAHLNQLPKPPNTMCRDLPPSVNDIIFRALAKHPDDRPQSVDEFRTALYDSKDAGGPIGLGT